MRRAHLLLAVPVLLLGLAGCGDDKADAPSAGTSEPAASAPAPSDDGADAEAPENLCDLVTAAELSTALGATVTTKNDPSGNCQFDQEDPRALSGSVGVVGSADTNGGFDGYVSGIDGTLKNPTAHPLDGLSGRAVVKVGVPAYGGSTNLMVAGVVDRGSFLLSLNLIQAEDMTEADLVTAATNVLRLVDSKTE